LAAVEVAWIVGPGGPAARLLERHLPLPGVDGDVLGPAAPAPRPRYDVVVHAGWRAARGALAVPGERRAALVAELEDRATTPRTPERLAATIALDLPVVLLAAGRAVADVLALAHPDAPRRELPLGRGPLAPRPAPGGPLRVAAADPSAVRALADVRATHRVVGVEEADVVVLLEPPDAVTLVDLLRTGAVPVVAEGPRAVELVVHGESGLLCEPGDERGPARLVDALAADAERLGRLRAGALAAAARLPEVGEASAAWAAELHAVRDADPPDPAAAAARLLADLEVGLDAQRAVIAERDALAERLARLDRLAARPGVRQALAVGRRLLR